MTSEQIERLEWLTKEARSARLRLDRQLANKHIFEKTRQPLAQLRFALAEIEQIILGN